jgi:hypothetical protein
VRHGVEDGLGGEAALLECEPDRCRLRSVGDEAHEAVRKVQRWLAGVGLFLRAPHRRDYVDVEPDGVGFNRTSIEVSRIKEDADYEGARVRFHATLARARIPMQLDIGFGDVITPGPTDIEYPSLPDFPAPVLRAYPRETVVAEKVEALTALGLLNSRLKDFYDLALLSRMYPFEGERLVTAVSATFRHRGATVGPEPRQRVQVLCG